MSNQKQTLFTDLILEVFKLNGALIEGGNALVKDLGITSARWQVLGALKISNDNLTVPQIASIMGLTRQSVQRLVNEMAQDKIVVLKHNKDHKRSKLVCITEKGENLYAEAMSRQEPWAKKLSLVLTMNDIEHAHRTLRELNIQLKRKKHE